MRDDQRRPLQFLDHIRHREGLARAGDAEQRLVAVARLDRLQSASRSPAPGRRAGGSWIRARRTFAGNMGQPGSRHNGRRCATCSRSCAIFATPTPFYEIQARSHHRCRPFALVSFARADTFYVANFGVNSITEYDDERQRLAFHQTPSSMARTASRSTAAGNLYVSTNSNTIEKFSPDGTRSRRLRQHRPEQRAGPGFRPERQSLRGQFRRKHGRDILPGRHRPRRLRQCHPHRPGSPSTPAAGFTSRTSATRSSASPPTARRSAPSPTPA